MPRYLWTWTALLLLTFLSVGIWSLGQTSIGVALAIASVKGGLVTLYFMHLVEQRFANRLVVLVSALVVLVLVLLVIADVALRRTT